MIDLISQTWGVDSRGLGDFLTDALESGEFTRMDVAAAYATGSGVRCLLDITEPLRASGGALRVFLGIDGNATTRDALERLLDQNIATWIVHNGDSSTRYHPKAYFIDGPRESVLVIGSNNLTAGGLYSNYEACLVVRFPADDEHGRQVTKQADAFFCALLESGQALTREMLEELVARGILSTDATWREPTLATGTLLTGLDDIFPCRPVRRPPPPPVIVKPTPGAMSPGPSPSRVKDTMIQDVNPLNASIYLDNYSYVGGRKMIAAPKYFAPYFSQECLSLVGGYGIRMYSRVLHSLKISLADLRKLDRDGIERLVSYGPHRDRWKRGLRRIVDRERREGWNTGYDPHRLYFLDAPVHLGHVIEKCGRISQIPHGYGTSFARLKDARCVEDLTL